MNETPFPDQYKKMPRLYVAGVTLAAGEEITLPESQAHYIRNVMRRSAGDSLRLFNGRDGEWLGTILESRKNKTLVSVSENLLVQLPPPDLWALASPVKKESFEFMIEKATELGASRIIPVLCARTVVRRGNHDRAHAIAVEAAEQCERGDVPEIAMLQDLREVLATWNPSRKLIFCLERHQTTPIASALQAFPLETPLAVLTGPEGGFSPQEIETLLGLPFVVPVSLGTRILRAETALIAALALTQFRCTGRL